MYLQSGNGVTPMMEAGTFSLLTEACPQVNKAAAITNSSKIFMCFSL